MKKRIMSHKLQAQLAEGGRKARQMSPLSVSEAIADRPNKQKAQELQARIDMVVEQALRAERSGNGVDVVFGAPYRARHGTLKAFKVG